MSALCHSYVRLFHVFDLLLSVSVLFNKFLEVKCETIWYAKNIQEINATQADEERSYG